MSCDELNDALEKIRLLKNQVRDLEDRGNCYVTCQEASIALAGRVATLENLFKELEPKVRKTKSGEEQKPEVELKPCFFCPGGGALYVTRQHLESRESSVYCLTCGCNGPPRKTEQEAKTAWNDRSPTDEASKPNQIDIGQETVECPFCRQTWMKPQCTS